MWNEVPQPTTAAREPEGGSESAARAARAPASRQHQGWLSISLSVRLTGPNDRAATPPAARAGASTTRAVRGRVQRVVPRPADRVEAEAVCASAERRQRDLVFDLEH